MAIGLTPEQEEAAREFLIGLAGVLKGDNRNCLHCGKEAETLKKHGRSVYAYPCGCRQYQGDVPAWVKRDDSGDTGTGGG